jgi:hypothetical protein
VKVFLKPIQKFILKGLIDSFDFNSIIEYCSTKEYYLRIIGVFSFLSFLFEIIYTNFDNEMKKTGFGYFDYGWERHKNYLFSKNELNL